MLGLSISLQLQHTTVPSQSKLPAFSGLTAGCHTVKQAGKSVLDETFSSLKISANLLVSSITWRPTLGRNAHWPWPWPLAHLSHQKSHSLTTGTTRQKKNSFKRKREDKAGLRKRIWDILTWWKDCPERKWKNSCWAKHSAESSSLPPRTLCPRADCATSPFVIRYVLYTTPLIKLLPSTPHRRDTLICGLSSRGSQHLLIQLPVHTQQPSGWRGLGESYISTLLHTQELTLPT